jgi:hypothetical protein
MSTRSTASRQRVVKIEGQIPPGYRIAKTPDEAVIVSAERISHVLEAIEARRIDSRQGLMLLLLPGSR